MERLITMKTLLTKHKHLCPLLIFLVFYLSGFAFIEHMNTSDFTIIHMAIDDKIPFCEFFIIPYFLWFFYMAIVIIFLYFNDIKDYYKNFLFLAIGMTIFLMVSAIFPNGHELRPEVMPRDNIFTSLVSYLYTIDTPTNILPSIHVYNSIGAHLGIATNKTLCKHKIIPICSSILCISIILATVFLKQHSMVDLISGCILGLIVYILIYKLQLFSFPIAKQEKTF